MPPADARPTGQIDQLDGVRALAVLAVMTFHDFWTGWGYLGVDVFFVLSGLLITGVLVGEREQRGRVDLRRFYARRMLRLYPALAAMLVLTTPFAAQLSQDGSWRLWWGAVAVSATYTANLAILVDGTQWLGALGPMWSLAVEMQFYLVWPLLLTGLLGRSVDRRALAAGVAVLAAAALSLFWLLGTAARPGLAVAPSYFRPDARFGELLAGCALALALSLRRGPLPRGADRALSVLALAGLALLVGAWPLLRGQGTVAPMPLVALGTTLVLARLVTSDRALLSRALRIPPLPQIGRISYAVYLWQLPILALAAWLVPDATLQEVVYWGATLAAGAASGRFVERPFLRRQARLRRARVEAGIHTAPEPPPSGGRAPAAASQAPGLHDRSAA